MNTGPMQAAMVYLNFIHLGKAFYTLGDAISPLFDDDRVNSLVILLKLH